MNVLRFVAGCFTGGGALLLIYKGYITEGAMLLSTMLAFFVGEANGKRKVEGN